MGAMKKSLFYAIILSAFLTFPVSAATTVEQTTDAEYIINTGYSEQTAEDVFLMKNRATGKPVEPLYGKMPNRFTRFFKMLYASIDPSIEEADRLHHDIHKNPSFYDL